MTVHSKPNSWRAACGWFLICVLGLWVLSPLVSKWLWLADLGANTVSIGSILSAMCFFYSIGRRRRYRALGWLVVGLVGMVWIFSTPRARQAQTDEGTPIVFLTYNASTIRDDVSSAIALLESTQADVVAVTEANAALLEAIASDSVLATRFAYREMPPWKLSNTRMILSRYPLESLIDRPALPKGDLSRALRLVRVKHSSGSFVVMQLHPKSPRNPKRWQEGNRLVHRAVDELGKYAGKEPIVVLADMNSTPTGWRSRYLSQAAGLLRCKPRRVLKGTYPAWMPSALSLAIDDAWVSKEWVVSSWTTVGSHGSDHRAVEIGLRFSETKQ